MTSRGARPHLTVGSVVTPKNSQFPRLIGIVVAITPALYGEGTLDVCAVLWVSGESSYRYRNFLDVIVP